MTAPPGQWGVPPTPPPAEPRSRKKAALYAFFLGALGVHNFYLGQRKRGIGHIVLLGLAVLGFVAVGFYTLFVVFWYSDLYLGHTMDDTAQALSVVLMVLPFALIAINMIWAIVEGIVILAGPPEP